MKVRRFFHNFFCLFLPILFSLYPIHILTSCAPNLLKKIDVEIIKCRDILNSIENGNKTKIEMNKNSFSVKDLLYGNVNLNNGNYILIIGSNTTSEMCEFMSGDSTCKLKEQWGKNNYSSSKFYQAFSLIENDMQQDLPLVFFIDYFFTAENINSSVIITKNNKKIDWKKSKISDTNIGPFSVWSKNDLEVAHNLNPEWDKEKKIIEGDYIRYDQSAINYRDFINYAKTIYEGSKSFGLNNNCYIAYFVNGYFKETQCLPITTEKFVEKISNEKNGLYIEKNNE